MTSVNECPDPSIVPDDVWMQDDFERAVSLNEVSRKVIKEYVTLDFHFYVDSKCGSSTAYDYTCQVISPGLLYLNFRDAVHEGDGDGVLRIWKYILLIWKATGHRNYACEVFPLLFWYHLLLSPNLAEQLKWSRFINVHGLPGHNIRSASGFHLTSPVLPEAHKRYCSM